MKEGGGDGGGGGEIRRNSRGLMTERYGELKLEGNREGCAGNYGIATSGYFGIDS